MQSIDHLLIIDRFMTQQTEVRATGKTIEMAKGSLWRPTYTPLNLNAPSKITTRTITDITFGGAWHKKVTIKQEDSHCTAPEDKQLK